MAELKNRIPLLLSMKEVRDKRRYTQKDMAQGTNITETAISRFMRYDYLDNVSFLSMVKIARWLDVNPLELFEEEEDEG